MELTYLEWSYIKNYVDSNDPIPVDIQASLVEKGFIMEDEYGYADDYGSDKA